MSDMKCPFCNSELHKDFDGYYTCYTDNCGCMKYGGNGASGSESLWQTLIDTKKKLDIAIEVLKGTHEYYEYCATRLATGHKARWDWVALTMDEDILKALEQITALEQKD